VARRAGVVHLATTNNFLNASDDPVLQHDFDAMRMVRRLCQDSLDDTFRELAGPLILFFNDADLHAGFDIGSVLAVHFDIWITS
jgi:hypothetical protein